MIRAVFGFVDHDPANVRLSAALDGGALMDVGCYCVSGARLIAGEPERVAGEQALGGQDDGVDVAFAGIMRVRRRHHRRTSTPASRSPARTCSRSSATRGRCDSPTPGIAAAPGSTSSARTQTERIEIEPRNSYRLEAENMSAAIRGEAPLLLGRDDAVGQARTIEALYQAADTAERVPMLMTCLPARRRHWARSSASSAN